MSRSGYSDGLDNWELIKWRGQVASAIRGKRGQALLLELAKAMDAMPVKELIANDFQAEGRYCALGVVGAERGIDMSKIDPYESDEVAEALDIARALACEIVFQNDEGSWRISKETPVQRWARMRAWVDGHINRSAVPAERDKGGQE